VDILDILDDTQIAQHLVDVLIAGVVGFGLVARHKPNAVSTIRLEFDQVSTAYGDDLVMLVTGALTQQHFISVTVVAAFLFNRSVQASAKTFFDDNWILHTVLSVSRNTVLRCMYYAGS